MADNPAYAIQKIYASLAQDCSLNMNVKSSFEYRMKVRQGAVSGACLFHKQRSQSAASHKRDAASFLRN